MEIRLPPSLSFYLSANGGELISLIAMGQQSVESRD